MAGAMSNGLANEIADPARLNDELRKRHPEGWGLKLGDGFSSLLETPRARRDALCPREARLDRWRLVWQLDPEPFLKLARQHGWWDLWAAVVRTTDSKYFNARPVHCSSTTTGSTTPLAWNGCEHWPASPANGIGRASVLLWFIRWKTTSPRGCIGRYPALVHGPFKPNVVPTLVAWWPVSC